MAWHITLSNKYLVNGNIHLKLSSKKSFKRQRSRHDASCPRRVSLVVAALAVAQSLPGGVRNAEAPAESHLQATAYTTGKMMGRESGYQHVVCGWHGDRWRRRVAILGLEGSGDPPTWLPNFWPSTPSLWAQISILVSSVQKALHQCSGNEWGPRLAMNKRKDKINFIPIRIHTGINISVGWESGGLDFEFFPLTLPSLWLWAIFITSQSLCFFIYKRGQWWEEWGVCKESDTTQQPINNNENDSVIHVDLQQKPLQYCKVISLQLK